MTHRFKINSQTITLSSELVVAVYAMGKLPQPTTVAAIKLVREMYRIGLYEAKHICDFIYQNGSQREGVYGITITPPKVAVEYEYVGAY